MHRVGSRHWLTHRVFDTASTQKGTSLGYIDRNMFCYSINQTDSGVNQTTSMPKLITTLCSELISNVQSWALQQNRLCTETRSPAKRLFVLAEIPVESTRKIFIFGGKNKIYEIKVSDNCRLQFYKWNHCQRHCMISTSNSYFGSAMQNTSTWPSAHTLYNSLYILHHEVA